MTDAPRRSEKEIVLLVLDRLKGNPFLNQINPDLEEILDDDLSDVHTSDSSGVKSWTLGGLSTVSVIQKCTRYDFILLPTEQLVLLHGSLYIATGNNGKYKEHSGNRPIFYDQAVLLHLAAIEGPAMYIRYPKHRPETH